MAKCMKQGIKSLCDNKMDITSKGDRVKILTPGEVSLFEYTRNADMSDPEIIDDAAQYLDITESQAFQYYLDDVDKKQMDKASAFEKSTMRNAAYKISDYADSFVYKLYSKMVQDTTFSSFDSADVLTLLAAADKAMRLANVPESETKYLEISPDVYAKFVLADIAKDTDNSKVLETGLVKKLWSMNIYVSNNIVTTGTTVGSTSYCIVRTNKAVAYAEQINQSESLRHPKRFGDIHRGLFLCGAKLIVPKEAVCFKVITAAESA